MWIDTQIKIVETAHRNEIEHEVNLILGKVLEDDSPWCLKGPVIPVYGNLGVITRYVQTLVKRQEV